MVVQEAVARAGKTPSEWARDRSLSSVVVGSHTQMEMHIFTELVGIQMLLMNTLEPPLRGDKIAQEQLTILFRQVQSTKATKAQELLDNGALPQTPWEIGTIDKQRCICHSVKAVRREAQIVLSLNRKPTISLFAGDADERK